MPGATQRKTLNVWNAHSISPDTDVLDNLTVKWVLGKLSAQECDIIVLRHVYDYTFSEIGEVVGRKYRAKPFSASVMRYHHARLMKKVRKYREMVR